MDITLALAIGGVIYSAASEIIGIMNIKPNSVVQLIMEIGGVIWKKTKNG